MAKPRSRGMKGAVGTPMVSKKGQHPNQQKKKGRSHYFRAKEAGTCGMCGREYLKGSVVYIDLVAKDVRHGNAYSCRRHV